MCSPATPSIWRLAIHPTAKLVLLALDHYHRPESPALCELGQGELASACGLVIRHVRRVLRDLHELGHIEIITRRDEKGRKVANAYRLKTAHCPEDMGVLWTAYPEDISDTCTSYPEDMGVLWMTQPEDMGVLWTETDPGNLYGEMSNLTSIGHGCPLGPEDMGVRSSLSLKEVTAVTAKPLSKNQNKGGRESGGRDIVGPRQNPRLPSATLSNPPGFDWRGIAEELRPDLHQLDHVWAKFAVYQAGKVLTLAQHEKHWRLWVMREHKAPAPRAERPAVRRSPGAFLASLPAAPLAGHYEVIHEHA